MAALGAASLFTVVEFVSVRGSDNLTLPIAAGLAFLLFL
jgi:dolichol kinase